MYMFIYGTRSNALEVNKVLLFKQHINSGIHEHLLINQDFNLDFICESRG